MGSPFKKHSFRTVDANKSHRYYSNHHGHAARHEYACLATYDHTWPSSSDDACDDKGLRLTPCNHLGEGLKFDSADLSKLY